MSAAPAYGASTSQAPFNASGYPPHSQAPGNSYYQQHGYGTSNTPPIVSSPYSAPGQTARGFGRNGVYDPEEEARIAEWSSAYTPKDDSNNKKGGQGAAARAIPAAYGDAAASPDPETLPAGGGKQKTVVRQGGGKTWEDASLLEWDPMHPRLFVGNLAGEVTDESLLKAFSKYPSVSKARVVRDKKSTKSKGYGFVSFANTDDYFRAAKDMEGKYIGSHPVRITRASTEINATTKRDNNHGKNAKQNKKAKGGIAGLLASGNFTGNGVQKYPQQKGTKASGPKMLG
ncbi:RNA-binding domain-containing protein [Lojkania enalia]|uniref:RNA-binding domain-containing protein n=1 Tax=Lojkania enalia TaxID=147567 RepID=A0A9P4N968_9PLEO|nr:RNA-binding domain-containing protein [Didymosphaeria enalia]